MSFDISKLVPRFLRIDRINAFVNSAHDPVIQFTEEGPVVPDGMVLTFGDGSIQEVAAVSSDPVGDSVDSQVLFNDVDSVNGFGDWDGSVLALGGLAPVGDVTVTALDNPNAPVVTNVGTAGVTSYSYKVVAKTATGHTAASSAGSTTTGNAALSVAHYNQITFDPVQYALTYDIYRTAGGATQGLIIEDTVSLTPQDTGLAGDASSAPATNTTGLTTVLTLKASSYESSDGSAGINGTVTTAGLVGKTMTFKNGLLVGFA